MAPESSQFDFFNGLLAICRTMAFEPVENRCPRATGSEAHRTGRFTTWLCLGYPFAFFNGLQQVPDGSTGW